MSYRWWMFTINNFTNQDEIDAQNLLCTYLVYGREVAPTTVTPHMQGFVVFPNTLRFSAVSRLFGGRGHWDAVRGTNQEASDYCRKDGDFVEFGKMRRPNEVTDMGTRS
jgi:Putative viral replication protein